MDPDTPPEATLVALSAQLSRIAKDLPGPLRRVRVHAGDTAVEVEWQEATAAVAAAPAPPAAAVPPDTPAARPAEGEPHAAVPVAGEAVLASPMVGTFYRASGPSEAPFVDVGDTVEEGHTVGVIEAMKLFNPITAEMPGVIKEILVRDAEPVEFGQPLIRIAVGADGLGAG
ncbi:acetyl-CoA carboxylase biotin carboxyl carrier protein [Actinoplanes sp. NPDC051411]|uniref:acetyl-CoA carboxylase biotin carboxyl carrier protein n=1 Tax=Actinoplanes sp. NPDC051411 TaxID=3155522 RepID=UPI003434D09B